MSKIKYTKEKLEEAVKVSDSISDVVRLFGNIKSGSVHQHISKRIKEFKIDTSHFTRKKRYDKSIKKVLNFEDILVYDRLDGRREKTKILRRALLESGVIYECSRCGNDGKWEGEEMTLEIDHINEDSLDNNKNNLRFLCPNCHSLRGNNVPRRKPKKCVGCAKYFNNTNKLYCSNECYQLYRGWENNNVKICKNCNKEFNSRAKKFCSNKCVGEHKSTNSDIPTLEQLLIDFSEIKTFVAVGKKYDVSDNAVRKWFKKYGIDPKKVK